MVNYLNYFRMLEAQVCGYSILTAAISIYFLSTLFPKIIIDTPLSVLSMMFFLSISIGGFLSVFSSNDRVRVLYAYFLLAQIILSLVFVIVTATTVDENQVKKNVLKFLNKEMKDGKYSLFEYIQKSMKCCFYHYFVEEEISQNIFSKQITKNFTRILNDKNFDNDDIPLEQPFVSCCPKLDKDGKCFLSKAYKTGCHTKIQTATRIYKITTIVLFILSLIFQVFLFYSYLRNARY